LTRCGMLRLLRSDFASLPSLICWNEGERKPDEDWFRRRGDCTGCWALVGLITAGLSSEKREVGVNCNIEEPAVDFEIGNPFADRKCSLRPSSVCTIGLKVPGERCPERTCTLAGRRTLGVGDVASLYLEKGILNSGDIEGRGDAGNGISRGVGGFCIVSFIGKSSVSTLGEGSLCMLEYRRGDLNPLCSVSSELRVARLDGRFCRTSLGNDETLRADALCGSDGT